MQSDVAARVAAALRNYGALAPQAIPVGGDDGLDDIPPEHGCDRFLLPRRVSCDLLADEPADSFGLLLLGDADAPILAQPDGTTRLALGPLYRTDPTYVALLEQ